jgi:acetyltransferase-like isoleucine patch superfamily enzyme
MIDRLLLYIRRRETPLAERAYRLGKAARGISMPVIPGLHQALYQERRLRLTLWQNILRIVYWEPLFKSQCEQVGCNLRLLGGIPQLMGARIRIYIGDDVAISGVTTFVGSKMADAPVLAIGHGSSIGYQTSIITGHGVYIGNHVLIGNRVFLAGDDSHPLDPVERAANRPPRQEDVRGVWIEDGVWVGEGATILKGVHVGKGSVVGAHAVVTRDVPPYSVVAGNPARIVKRITAG